MIKIHEIFLRLIKCDTDNVTIVSAPAAASYTVTPVDLSVVTVTTAGAQTPINSTALLCFRVEITAQAANTGLIYVGGSGCGETNTMAAGDTKEIDFGVNSTIDLNALYIDASVSGEGVEIVYYTAA